MGNSSILEIGAGTGRTAYYASKFGIKDITILDLPYVCILSGYYLIKALPNEDVVLYGENPHDETPSIKILPYWCIQEIPDQTLDLTLNQDSFPEINYNTVMEYLSQIHRTTKHYFLSINQEGECQQTGPDRLQLVVPQLMNKLGNAYKRIYRFPYWEREGYIEELYKVT